LTIILFVRLGGIIAGSKYLNILDINFSLSITSMR
jgi:hypothetical protein